MAEYEKKVRDELRANGCYLQKEEMKMKIWEASGENVRITLNNGKTFEGIGEYFTSDLDNPSGIASICVGLYELYENEIASIEPIVVQQAISA